jgi:hypothetical protein
MNIFCYTPKNYVADGKFKKIEVKVKGKKKGRRSSLPFSVALFSGYFFRM